jgi:hypothetical protein
MTNISQALTKEARNAKLEAVAEAARAELNFWRFDNNSVEIVALRAALDALDD